MLGLYAAAAVLLPLPFWPFRERPEDWGCGDSEPPGHDAALDAWRSGAIPLHAGAALILLAALWAWSARHNEGKAGWRTTFFVVLTGVYIPIAAAWEEAFAPFAIATYIGAALIAQNAAVAGALAAVLLLGVALRTPPPGKNQFRLVAGLGWLVLLFGVPAHLTALYAEGYGPIIC